MQRLSPQDASFLHLEDAVSHMHLGVVAILEGPPPLYDAFVERVRANLPRVPRYRQKVHFVPLALSRPVWVDSTFVISGGLGGWRCLGLREFRCGGHRGRLCPKLVADQFAA